MNASGFFVVGIAGTALSAEERAIFRRFPPAGVILFARNIAGEEELSALVAEIRRELPQAFLCVDQEGGPVDRFRAITGGSPSFARSASLGDARGAGTRAGEICAAFSIDWDLAPVVDRAVEGAGRGILGERAAAEDEGEVARAAVEFLGGLGELGVAGCLKHFPGLGRAEVDSHRVLPRIPEDPAGEERDLAPFRTLAGTVLAIMVSHAAGDRGLPGTLDADVATRLLRENAGFSGLAISDDLEMGALAAYGDLPERAAAAFEAGCDLLCVGKAIDALPAAAESVGRGAPAWRAREARSRLDAFRSSLSTIRGGAIRSPRRVDEIAAAFRRSRDEAGEG